MTFRYGSVCSGVEAASVAWEPLGWKPSFFSEIDKFPRRVLKHRFPEVPLHGDFTTIEADQYEPIDLLVGGTPCQSFSIAGLRGGLGDDRGNLALEYLRLADRLRPRWLVWENVPGVLSSNGGRDFGAILGGMAELGYGFAYRVLDAQFFGVAQRRRRVFVVGYLGDWRCATAVLFERQSLSGHPAPRDIRREGDGDWPPVVASTFYSAFGDKCGLEDQHIYSQKGGNFCLDGGRVRKLTCIEWERCLGFPDDYTAIPWRGKPADQCPDGPRYKALGNSMAVPVMRWIGERIQMVEEAHNKATSIEDASL